MDILKYEELKALARPRKNIGVSIYIPTSPDSKWNIRNPLLLKQQLDLAKTKLLESGVEPKEVRKLLSKGYDLTEDESFWRDRYETLAVFLNIDEINIYKLSFSHDEVLNISRYFYLKPILKDFLSNKRLYVLVLEAGGSKIFEFDKHNYIDITPPSLTKSSEKYADHFQSQGEIGFHIGKSGGDETQPGYIAHGHDNTAELNKLREIEFINIITKEITKISDREKLPVVIVGIKSAFLAHEFRSAYEGEIIDDYIIMETSPLDMKKLQLEVAKIIEKLEKAEVVENAEMATRLLGTGLDEENPDLIVKRSFEGRVGALFVNSEKDAFGIINIFNNACEARVTNNPEDEDLTNIAIINTWENGGKVIFVPSKNINDRPMLASLRY